MCGDSGYCVPCDLASSRCSGVARLQGFTSGRPRSSRQQACAFPICIDPSTSHLLTAGSALSCCEYPLRKPSSRQSSVQSSLACAYRSRSLRSRMGRHGGGHRKRRRGPSLIPLQQVGLRALDAPDVQRSGSCQGQTVSECCLQALINLSKASVAGQLVGDVVKLTVDLETSLLFQSVDVGEPEPALINHEVRERTQSDKQNVGSKRVCGFRRQSTPAGLPRMLRSCGTSDAPCTAASLPSCHTCIFSVRSHQWSTANPLPLPLQLTIQQRRALPWPPQLQLSLQDAVFAAHALGCLKVASEAGEELSLEVGFTSGFHVLNLSGRHMLSLWQMRCIGCRWMRQYRSRRLALEAHVHRSHSRRRRIALLVCTSLLAGCMLTLSRHSLRSAPADCCSTITQQMRSLHAGALEALHSRAAGLCAPVRLLPALPQQGGPSLQNLSSRAFPSKPFLAAFPAEPCARA